MYLRREEDEEEGEEIAIGQGSEDNALSAIPRPPHSFYETVSSFLNKEGGTIVLGVTDDGQVKGIPPSLVDKLKKDIISSANASDVISPPVTLQPQAVEINGDLVIYVKLAVSSQVHTCRGVPYDRENDSDIALTDEARIKELYFRKRQIFTESEVLQFLTLEDLDEKLFEKARQLIRTSNLAHPWLAYSNEELLRSSLLYRKDYRTGDEGLTLATALIFGKDSTIQSMLPAYKIERVLGI